MKINFYFNRFIFIGSNTFIKYYPMVFNTCCCCLDLRAGAFVIATWEIIYGIVMFGLSTLGDAVSVSILIIAIEYVIAGACLLYGATKYHQKATVANLVWSIIGIVKEFITAIVLFASSDMIYLSPGTQTKMISDIQNHNGTHNESEESSGVITSTANTVGVVFLVGAFVHIYFWLCVYSFLKGLKSGSISSLSVIPVFHSPLFLYSNINDF